MQANGIAVKNTLKKQHEFIKSVKPLSDFQSAAFTQLQEWLPTASFDVFSRNVPDSVLHQYQVAVAEISESIGTPEKIWVLASIPAMSDTLFISFHHEYPKPFFDFIASLDALSETADQMVDGYRGKIQHSILENRNQKSYLLAQFQQLWPTPIFGKSKNLNTSIASSQHSFKGCLVLYSENLYTKLNPSTKLKYELQAIIRNSEFLTDLALPAASYYDQDLQILTDIETAPISKNVTQKTAINNITHTSNADSPFKPNAALHNPTLENSNSHSVTPQDIKAINKIRSQNRSYVLFGVFLLVSVAALVYLNFDTIDLHNFFN